jgi:hypothetical protein
MFFAKLRKKSKKTKPERKKHSDFADFETIFADFETQAAADLAFSCIQAVKDCPTRCLKARLKVL